MSGKISRYTKIFEDWEFEEVLGKGTSGIVYKVSKNVGGLRDESAVKAITIYDHDGKKDKLSENFRIRSEEVIEARKKKALEEVRLMQKLRGNTNIVDFYDYKICPWNEPNGFGVDLLLRIELLHNLVRELEEGKMFSEQEIIHLGKDICSALILCHSRNIMHRDIKPDNIYRNDHGSYKLGDFGISRIIDIAQGSNMTVGCGTHPYTAPEQYEQDTYDFRVDIYSLGLVLYELTNHNRLPFARGIREISKTEVLERIMGKAFPAPAQASDALARVIMKACAHRPEERYQSAEEFWDALNRLEERGKGRYRETADEDIYATNPANMKRQRKVDIYATNPANAQKQYEYQDAAISQGMQLDARMRGLIERAEQGDMVSQYNLAWCYDLGEGIEKNPEEAVKWYRMSAEQGYAMAQLNIGICYMNAYGVAYDAGEAVKWYLKAARQGYAEAQNRVGVCYDGGNGVVQDYTEAIKWFRMAAEQGHAAAQCNLGIYYADGHSVQQNMAEALKWYFKSAEQGYAEAQNYIGVCYDGGNGVVQDFNEAIKWFQMAAEQGHAHAQNNLGYYYSNGLGVEIDEAEAVKWYRRAAEQGHAAAQNRLGVCYNDGLGVERNAKEAIKWYRKAAEQGSDWAYWNMGTCFESGFGVEQDIQEAIKCYRKAAELGNAEAAERLKQIQ